MSDSVDAQTEQPKNTEEPTQSLPTSSNENDGTEESEGFGVGNAPTILKPKAGAKLGPILPAKVESIDAQNLPGAFFILTVTPSLKTTGVGRVEWPGVFNVLAYDPHWNESDSKETVAQRYQTKPPYIETLTERGKVNDILQIDETRSAISGIFGDFQAPWSYSDWPWDNPVSLTLSFQGHTRLHKEGERVGFAWISGPRDAVAASVAIKKENFRPIMKRDNRNWKWEDFKGKGDQYTQYTYRVEYYTKLPLQPKQPSTG